MANITKREGKNGTSYYITVFKGELKNEDGKIMKLRERTTFKPTKTTPAAIKKEVEDYAREFEKAVLSGEFYSGNKTAFQEYVKVWDETWASDLENLTASVRESYLDILKRRVYPYIGHLKISDINTTHIQNIYSKMKKEGKALKTIKRTHTAINSVFRHACSMNVIGKNPCDNCMLPKVKKQDRYKKDIHYFTLEQAKTFLNALTAEYRTPFKASERISKNGKKVQIKAYTERYTIPIQYQPYFYLAIYGGFRRGELIALTWEDIDFENRTVTINKAVAKTKAGQIVKEPKTEKSNRKIKLPGKCFDVLGVWKNEQKQLCISLGSCWEGYRGKEFDKNNIFIQLDSGRRMDVDTPGHKFKEIIRVYNQTCKKEEDKLPDIRLHDLRHTSATLLLSENTDIATISHRLGHSEISVTLNVYSHWMEKTDEKASETLEALFA